MTEWITHVPGDCPVHPETVVVVELPAGTLRLATEALGDAV